MIFVVDFILVVFPNLHHCQGLLSPIIIISQMISSKSLICIVRKNESDERSSGIFLVEEKFWIKVIGTNGYVERKKEWNTKRVECDWIRERVFQPRVAVGSGGT